MMLETIGAKLGYKYLRYCIPYRLACWKQKEKIDYLKSILADDMSVKILDAAIDARKTRNFKCLEKYYDNRFEKSITYLSGETISYDSSQYFADILQLSDNEIFIDREGYVGDTTLNFIEQTHGRFNKIHVFEPVKNTFLKIVQNLEMANLSPNKVILHNVGLYSSKKEISFNLEGSSARIDKHGKISVKLVSLDDYLSKNELKEVTYIKLDVKGAELEALKGMRKTILKYKPKLAICIYHKPKDLWEIPLFIKELNPSYSLYIRQHYYKDETVCYATI
ncbi:MAG: FkbM family methyltransferase [Bacteroidales bacterium]|nr:FkbM family methyltransferase [Bacteroidales bacterium]